LVDAGICYVSETLLDEFVFTGQVSTMLENTAGMIHKKKSRAQALL
jgi:hypothetical protein